MADIYVDYDALATSASTAASLAQELINLLGDLSQDAGQLSSCWIGEDADEAIKNLKAALSELQEQNQYFSKFSEALQASADLWRMMDVAISNQ